MLVPKSGVESFMVQKATFGH